MEDPKKYLINTSILDFDLIHHQCRVDKLQDRWEGFFAIKKNDFKTHSPSKGMMPIQTCNSVINKIRIYGLKGA